MSRLHLFTLAVSATLLSACASNYWPQEERTVYFDTGKSTLTADARARLDYLAGALNEKNVAEADVVGYADHRGEPAANERLSLARANAVQEYLAAKGFNRAVVKIEARGELVSSGCEDVEGAERSKCLWPDRKVEVKICMNRFEPNSGTNTGRNHAVWQGRMSSKLKTK